MNVVSLSLPYEALTLMVAENGKGPRCYNWSRSVAVYIVLIVHPPLTRD